MQAVLEYLFGAASFVPHGYCLLWRPDLLAIHAVSDVVTAVAYFSIPAALFVLLRRRADLSFRWIFVLFIAFIFACGATHVLDLITMWQPVYGLQGLVKAATAIVSATTAIMLWPMLPQMLALPSPAALRQANLDLEVEIAVRKAAEQALREAQEQLERRVDERTSALMDANARLQDANESKSRFVASVSHEIRTPMNAVLGFADLLAESGLDGAQQRYLAIIRDTGRQLLTLLNDILDVAKLEAGKLDLERVDFALAAVLEQVRSLFAPQAVERGLELVVEAAVPASLVLRGDPNRLRQVLVNLVGNGLKFTSRGSVALRVAPVPGAAPRLRFEVADTGIGIQPARQAELFQPFVQADSSTTRLYGGTGLGLAICKSLVQAMGGTIGLDSAPGRGSRFWFELPLERGDAVAAERGAPAPARIRPLDVLVADDVAANRELLGEILRRHGHRVRMAEDGAAAVAAVAERPPELVLMDIQMPVMDGIEATRRIRRLPGPAGRVPILALTANVMAQDRERYLAAGMERCLTKPVLWPELFAALAAVANDQLTATPAAIAAEEPSPRSSTLGVPLLDQALLEGMTRNLPADAMGKLLVRGLLAAAESHRRLEMALGDPVVLAREAHRLRGTAGSFGLARIAALAADIEDRLHLDEPITDIMRHLAESVVSTRAAVNAFCLTPLPK